MNLSCIAAAAFAWPNDDLTMPAANLNANKDINAMTPSNTTLPTKSAVFSSVASFSQTEVLSIYAIE